MFITNYVVREIPYSPKEALRLFSQFFLSLSHKWCMSTTALCVCSVPGVTGPCFFVGPYAVLYCQ